MLNFISSAQAQAVGGSAQNSIMQLLIPFGLMFLVIYFLILRPQNKRAKEMREMLASLKRGDKVVTSGGLIGTINKVIDDNQIALELAPDVEVQIVKGSVTQVLNKKTTATTPPNPDSDETKTQSVKKRVSAIKKKK
jgi:preprotein translocase subunit YajC